MPDPAVIDPEEGRRPRALLRSVLGEALRRARLEQGRTLADVALAARISMPYLSEVERGRKEVSSEVLAALCDALGIDLSDLLVAVVFNLTGDVPVASLGISRRATVGGLRHPSTRDGFVAPPARQPGDAYALAA
jgi:transcriptional regulator with XRE-family HTH domain